jgi:uncharacterized protein YbjT (DUF2867 family)
MAGRRRTDKVIFVAGATGHQGGAAAYSLAAAGWPVRALVRDPRKPAARALRESGVELVKGDLDDRPSLDVGLKDVYGVFSVQGWREKGVEGEVRMGENLADAALAAGVKHFIYSSVGGADRRTGIPHFDSKWRIEEHIRAIGLPFTVFRPVFFMYNFGLPEIQSSILKGTLAMAVKPNKPLQMLAVEDLGEFVRMAFERPGDFLGRAVELAGDELTLAEAARVFSTVLGWPVQFVEQPVEDVRRFDKNLAAMFEWFNERGYRADIPALRALHPGLMKLETWLRKAKWVKAA